MPEAWPRALEPSDLPPTSSINHLLLLHSSTRALLTAAHGARPSLLAGAAPDDTTLVVKYPNASGSLRTVADHLAHHAGAGSRCGLQLAMLRDVGARTVDARGGARVLKPSKIVPPRPLQP